VPASPESDARPPLRGLEGIRVLELGDLVSAPYASKLLADLGADVVKVEPPGGDRARRRGPFPGAEPDPEASGLFLYLNSNKRGVALDPTSPEGRSALERLVAETDVLIHDWRPERMAELGLGWEALRRMRPRLVVCSITPFGLGGPYSHYRAEELTLAHAGGWGWLSPGASDRPDLPPLKAFGHQADFQGGLAAAVASLGALFRAQRSGVGEHIDLSVQETIASFLEQALVYYTYSGLIATRLGQRVLNPWGIYECRDGLIFLCTIEQDQWERLVEFMGAPEWAQLELFADLAGRAENADALDMFLGEWIAQWNVDELYREGQRRRICFAPVLNMQQLSQADHLRERGFFVEVTHARAGTLTHPGAPYHLGEPWWGLRRAAPLLGEHNREVLDAAAPARGGPVEPCASSRSGASEAPPRERRLPLEGVRVADFTWVWAGPFCALQLAHLGAEVIKVESEARPDLGRRLPIFIPDTEPGLNRSGYFNQWNQGKRSLRLNLAEPGAIEVARRLASHCDVVVDNFATGVMDRVGLGYDELRKLRPDVIVASISGYGSTGPLRDYMAYGPAIAPLAGLSSLTGYPGDGPCEVGISYGDPNAGSHAAVAICAALAARERTGRGQHIDVSLWESMAVLVPEGWMQHVMNGTQPDRMGNRDPWMSPHGCFPCEGEDAWVTIACAGDGEWSALCGAMELPALASDPRFRTARDRKANEDELEKRIADWTRTRGRWEVTRALQAVGVAAFPSMTPADLASDPHLEARGFLTRLEHPEVGVRTHAGIPWRLDGAPNGVRAPAPLLGVDTRQIMRDLLGYSPEEIARLEADQVLY
jgi:crotonobetainyl-CoA:carnitine CoA-transferase CaiB-like acyl-CoA transferase